MRGAVPSLGASLRHVVLHRNSFETLSRLDLADNAVCVLLHRNRLSCRLPADSAPHQVCRNVNIGTFALQASIVRMLLLPNEAKIQSAPPKLATIPFCFSYL